MKQAGGSYFNAPKRLEDKKASSATSGKKDATPIADVEEEDDGSNLT